MRAEEGASAQALLDRVIAAKGGLDTLRAVKTLTVVTLSDLPSPNGVVAAKATTLLAYPDRVRVETELPDAKIVQAFDGPARGSRIRAASTTCLTAPSRICD